MLKRISVKLILLVLTVAALVVAFVACTPVSDDANYPYGIVDNEKNIANKDHTTKEEAIKRTSDSITNLKNYLKSSTVADTGYYMEFDFDIDTDTGDNFELKFRGNLYTYPYEIKDENGNVIGEDPDAKAIHNEVIKKSDLLIEWYNGHTNELMIGFYFDGVNASKENPGNHLYLNLRGYKRWYRNFGNTVMFQQIMRLITNLDIELILADNDSSIDQSINKFATYLGMAVNDNYKKTQNGSTTTLFYENLVLNPITIDINTAIHAVFSPFQDKIDPLTNKYLGFKFSTLGQVSINTLNADLAFHIEPDISETLDVLYGVDANMNGTSTSYGVSVPFRSNAYVRYSTRVSNDIKFDLQGYVEFIHGQYDFTALFDVPMFKLRYEGEVITSLTEKDNTLNKIDARFRNLSTQEYAVMLFYRDEKFYLNTEGIEDIYGAIQIDELGFPKVFYEGIDLAELLKSFYDTVNNGMVSIVDALLDPETYQGEGIEEGLIHAIMAKMRSEGDTMTLTVDIELIKEVLRFTQKVDPNEESPYYTLDDKGRPIYTTRGLVMLFSDWLGYDMEQIAAIFGVASAEILLERSWFEITYDVETNHIVIELFTSIRQDRGIVFRLTLIPVKIGEKVTFPLEMENWDSYKPLQEVKTLSATLNGDIRFASSAEVDLSKMLASFIDDRSGLNTVYKTAPNARILFTLVFDQYIQYTDPEGNDNLDFILGELEENGVEIDIDDMIGKMRGRMAFYFSMTVQSNRGEELIARLYAYNVSFNQDVYDRIEAGENVPEGYGYVYVDLTGGLNPGRTDIPLMKIREDYFMHSFFDYTGKTDAADSAATLSIYSILMAILEDSTFYTTDDAISITTSNRLLQRVFGIDDLVANFLVQVGFRQRVKEQYSVISMVDRFADYEVSELTDLEVLGVYDNTVPIHKTLLVEFRWRSGDTLIKQLKFKYYKEPEPNRDDFYNDEEYEAALEDYNEYIASKYNIDIVPDKDKYYPSVDGTFMGAERNYTLTVNGGSNQRNATARIESLYETEFRWEPFEDKPSSIRAVNSNNALVMPYPAEFSIDWSKVTVDGLERAYYTVTVGPGSLGEFTAEVAISVINRRVVNGDGTPADVVYVYSGGREVSASVGASLSIDPYDYIVSRYASSKRFEDGVFITDYLKSRASQVTLYFAGGDSERGFFDWYFDDADGVGNNRETAISERGGKLYLHTSFHNQIIALELIVEERVVHHIEIVGEEKENTYTVDVLDRSTYTLPVRPTVYFRDGAGEESNRVFAFNLVWSYAAVDNVTMKGAPLIDGQPSPFKGHIGNVVSAYLDIERAFGIGEWFGKQIVTLTVETPPKEISDLYEVENAKAAAGSSGKTVTAVSIGVEGTREVGYWIIDDRFESSYNLPNTVTAYFKDGTNKNYKVQWDTSTGLVAKNSGKYTVSRTITDNTEVEFYYVGASLDDVYEFNLVIVKLPYKGENVKFSAWNRTDGQADTQLRIEKNDAGRYIYKVNPYDDVFLVPNVLEEIFDGCENGIPIGTKKEGREPLLFRNKYAIEATVAGLEYVYVYGEGNTSVTATIEVASDGTVAKEIEFMNAGISAGDGERNVLGSAALTMSVSAVTDGEKKILIDGIAVPANGIIAIDGREFSARELVAFLLSNVKITMVDGSTKIRNPEIVNFNGVFNAGELQTGINLVLRMSIVPGILDYELTVKGHTEGVHPAVTPEAVEITLQPFDSDPENGERYKNGYSLTTHRVEFEDGTTATFSDWYVGAVNGIAGLKVGQPIRTITAEMLLAKYPFGSTVDLTVYTFREDDTKISIKFTIPTLDWTKFRSINYDGEFPISDGGIIVDDMYATDISSIRSVLDRLPTSIRFYNIEVNNVRWIAAEGAADRLANLRFDDVAPFALATATVNAGGFFDITLYIRFKECKITGADGYTAIRDDENGNLIVNVDIDPYLEGSSGVYTLPQDLNLSYARGARTHTFFDVTYKFGEILSAERNIPYIYNGYSDGLSGGERDYIVDIGRGQTVTFRVNVLDRTFKNYNFDGTVSATITEFSIEDFSTVAVDSSTGSAKPQIYRIDPYKVIAGEKYLPREISVKVFENSAEPFEAFVLPVVWTTDLRIDYEGSEITVIEGYIAGMGNQPLSFVAEVLKRPASAYDVFLTDESGELLEGYSHGNNAGAGIYNFRTSQEDPFMYGRDNLPKFAKAEDKDNHTAVVVPIEWKVEPSTFNVEGGTAVVHGYLAAEGVGHHITLTVETDVWTFVRIARPVEVNGSDYTAWEYRDMSPISFTFVSLMTEDGFFEMTDRAFRATFRVTDAAGASRYENKYFVPEAYAKEGDLKIYFNDDAIRQAAQSSAKAASSSFYLGSDDKVRTHVTGTITYLVEAPIIETESVVYYYNTSGGALYLPYILIDPLNPSMPDKAYAYTNWSPDGLVEWTITSTEEFGQVNLNSYLVGGLLRGKNFAFTLKDGDGSNITDQNGNAITELVSVQLLFLDRTVKAGEETTKVTTGGEERVTVSLTFKDSFDAYTYAGTVNPYGGYNEVIDALNAAASIYGSTRSVEAVYVTNDEGERVFKEFYADGRVYAKDIFAGAPIVWQE